VANVAAINGGAVFYKKLGKTTEVASVISISNNIFKKNSAQAGAVLFADITSYVSPITLLNSLV